MASSDFSDQLSEEHAEMAGTVVAGRYRLVRPIGAGGMATVWAATHLTLDQPIALKFLEVMGPQRRTIRERFLREAKVAAAVRHRNVVDIIDFGTSDSGKPFMAMELLVGESLADRMDSDKPILVPEVVRMMARLLSGLAAVHDAGLVHRDIKPENIFLVRDADGVYPKLLDFGISRVTKKGRGSTIRSVLKTTENAIVGTPQYMSPEQARALPDLDQRSDIWSAGVLLFELLTGRLPFDHEAVGDIIIAIATEAPPEFASLRPDLAGPVEDVVKRAMAKDPDDRFATARDMRAALLAAIAKTAAPNRGLSNYARANPDTIDSDLLQAITESYEPGDSGIIDVGEHLEVLNGRNAAPTLDAELTSPPPSLPAQRAEPPEANLPASTRRGVWVGAAIASVLAVVGGTLWLTSGDGVVTPTAVAGPEAPGPATPARSAQPPSASAVPDVTEAPAAPETITVTLRSVPERAGISLDGQPWTAGPDVRIPRDNQDHTIEVSVADGRSWRQEVTASEGAIYEVDLPPRVRRRSRGGHRPRGGLIRDPGF